jgi:hypothetical protein
MNASIPPPPPPVPFVPPSDPDKKPRLSWAELYDDFCILCAIILLGPWWRIGWGSIRLEGEDVVLAEEFEEQEAEILDEGNGPSGGPVKGKTVAIVVQPSTPADDLRVEDDGVKNGRHANALLTLALLHILHAMTTAHLSRIAELLPPLEEGPQTIQLSAKDVASFGLGPWSTDDARYLEWLAEQWGGGRRVVVRRTWRDFAWFFLGYG